MEWFKRASGVKIFIAIWLLVLLVPIWRLRAARQWHSNDVKFVSFAPPLQFYPNEYLGLNRRSEMQLAQQFPGEAAAQLAPMQLYTFNELDLQKNPSPRTRPYIEKYFNRYALLTTRFPRDIFVRKQWLRDSMFGELKVEPDALLESYEPTDKVLPRVPWLSVAQRQAALQSAVDGGKLEPDNAFWPWMEAILNFSFGRDQQAILALQKAGGCSRFDDDIDGTVRRRIALMHRIQSSDWEDDMAEQASIWLPHLAKMRATARATMWQAKQAWDRGDRARAIQIANTLQNAALPVARSRGSLITRLVGEAMIYISWQSTLKHAGIEVPKYSGDVNSAQRKAQRRLLAMKYANYALKNGRADYAKSALAIQPMLNGSELGIGFLKPDFDGLIQRARLLKQYHWVLSWLLTINCLSAALWMAMWLFTCKSSFKKSTVSRAMAIWVAFCIGCICTFLMVGARQIITGAYDSVDYVNPPTPEQASARYSLDHGLGLITIVICFIPVLVTAFPPIHWRPRLNISSGFDGVKVVRFTIYGSLFLGIVGTVMSPIAQDPAGFLSIVWPLPVFISLLAAFAACFFHIATTKGKTRLAVVFVAGGIALSLTALACLTSGEADGQFYASFVFVMALGFFLTGAYLMTVDLMSAEKRRLWSGLATFFGGILLRIRIMAAAVAVSCSLFYLCITLSSIPIRRDAQNAMNRQLEIGEIAYIEEKQAQK